MGKFVSSPEIRRATVLTARQCLCGSPYVGKFLAACACKWMCRWMESEGADAGARPRIMARCANASTSPATCPPVGPLAYTQRFRIRGLGISSDRRMLELPTNVWIKSVASAFVSA
jgi:hypothetical protein